MSKRLKRAVIHFLGGYTAKEVMKREAESFNRGHENCFLEIKCYLESLNGKPADEWCKLAYDFVCNGLNE